MKIEGRMIKIGRFWAVQIPLLLIDTQGTSRKDALEMAKDAVEGIVDSEGFEATVEEINSEVFTVDSNNERALLSCILKQQRSSRGLSIRDVAQNLGSNSPTSYSRYESGETGISIEKFTELMQAIDENMTPVINLFQKRA